jgi:hypothetical protein
MDPSAFIGHAPPEWIPFLILAALVLKGWQAWVNRKQKPEEPEDEFHRDPNVKG